MPKSNGPQKKTRMLLRKKPRQRGKVPPSHTVRTFNAGDRVAIVINPSIQKGRPFRRFQGLTGQIAGNQGDAYLVNVNVGGMVKTVISRPEHIREI